MKELCVIPTWCRNPYLHCSLERIRKQDSNLPIMVFSDRGVNNLELRDICRKFGAGLIVMPVHDYYGNSFVVLEALRWAYMSGAELIIYFEDDAAAHPDCLAWYREMHSLFDNIFCACGWVFNLFAPVDDPGPLFAPWFYAPSHSVKRDKLAQVIQHANPRYYANPREYVLKVFPQSILHNAGREIMTNFYEADAIFQFCLMQDGSQVVWPGVAKVDHVGSFGYNKPNGRQFTGPLDKAVAELESFIADPYERMAIFGRPIVEREVGHELPKRAFRWKVAVPGGWETEYVTEVSRKVMPERVHSVKLPEGSTIEAL